MTDQIAASEGARPDGRFVHLHNHTEYSLLDGMGRIADVVAAAASDGQPACAITDHGTLGGAWAFAHACREARTPAGTSVKPIIGMEAYVAGDRFNPAGSNVGAKSDDAVYQHLTLLATSPEGFRNLVILNNSAQESTHRKPLMDYDLLAAHHQGLICLTGCIGGPVAGPLGRSNMKAARKALARLVDALADQDRDGAALARHRLLSVLDDDHQERVAAMLPRLAPGREPEATRANLEDLLARIEYEGLQVARANLTRIVEAFGRDNVYVELMDHDIDVERWSLPRLVSLADEYGLPVVVTNDCHHVAEHHHGAHDVWLGMQTLKKPGQNLRTVPSVAELEQAWADPGSDEHRHWTSLGFRPGSHGEVTDLDRRKTRFSFDGHGHHVRTEAEMRDLHPTIAAWQDGCDNTIAIAERCAAWVLPERKPRLPRFSVPEGFDGSDDYLRHLTVAGAKERWGAKTPADVRERIDHELATISAMGVSDYFLITHDIIDWARSDRGYPTEEHPKGVPGAKKPILTGPGRGSASGSAVSFALGIVDVDPLKYALLFERFLEAGRTDLPDIDLDFEKDRAPEIVEYWRRVYGKSRVARVGTYQMSRSKAAVKAVARMVDEAEVGALLANAIPSVGGKPLPLDVVLDESVEDGERFREIVSSDPVAASIVETARIIEGTVANAGIHACAVIVSPFDLFDFIPMRLKTPPRGSAGDEKVWVTEWTGTELADLGMLKNDVLAIRNLDILSLAGEIASDVAGTDVSPFTVPDPDDPTAEGVAEAYRLIAEGHTQGMFQLASGGMTKLAANVKPTNLDDLTALVALYRPGPLAAGSHEHYADRKFGREAAGVDHLTTDPDEAAVIGPVLAPTHGLLCYQEQVMQLGGAMCGWDAGKRNKLRKAVGKKDKSIMDAMGRMFLADAVVETFDDDGNPTSMAFSRKTAERVWHDIKGTGSYAFNKSHAAAYGKLAFSTAWFKANHQAAFDAALLSYTEGADDRLPILQALASEGLRVVAPDVNRGRVRTWVSGNREVMLGLGEIRDVSAWAEQIVAERKENGEFTSASDVAARVRKVVTLDDGTQKVSSIPSNVMVALAESGALDSFGSRAGQVAGLWAEGVDTSWVPEWADAERSARERHRLGLSLTVNPLRGNRDVVQSQVKVLRDQWDRPLGRGAVTVGRALDMASERRQDVVVVGTVASWKLRPFRGSRMATMTLEGLAGEVLSVTLWPDKVEDLLPSFEPSVSDVVAVSGQLVRRERRQEVRTDDAFGGDDDELSGVGEDDAGDVVVESSVVTELYPSKMWRIVLPSTPEPELPPPAALDLASALVAGRAAAIPPVPGADPRVAPARTRRMASDPAPVVATPSVAPSSKVEEGHVVPPAEDRVVVALPWWPSQAMVKVEWHPSLTDSPSMMRSSPGWKVMGSMLAQVTKVVVGRGMALCGMVNVAGRDMPLYLWVPAEGQEATSAEFDRIASSLRFSRLPRLSFLVGRPADDQMPSTRSEEGVDSIGREGS